MNRRSHLALLAGSLAGTAFRSPAQTPADSLTNVSAGSFHVSAPQSWAAGAIVEKVASLPLYSAEAWQKLQENPLCQLKPFYGNRPEHWAIRFPALALKGEMFNAKEAGADPTAPQILIHQNGGWASIMKNGEHNANATARSQAELRSALTALGQSAEGDITPAYMDASLTFTCLKKKLNFKGGHGYRVVTQWTIEPELVRRGSLHYLFVGLSDDDTCQIIATFPLDMPELPSAGIEAEHLGYSAKRYADLTRDMSAYSAKAASWLESRASNFTPSLDSLDQLMESLSAETWR